MTEESSVSIDDVRALVAERHRFDEWLSALEARRDETPDHVFERVHGDYNARRAQVMTQLHDHVPGLEALVASLDERAANLAARSRAEEDEKAEAMLRHAVGEYDDDKWNDVRQRVESTLATLGGEQQALDAQRDDVRSLLDSARPEPEAEPEATADADLAVSSEAAGHETDDSSQSESSENGGTAEWLGAMTPAVSDAQDAEATSEAPSAHRDGGAESDETNGVLDGVDAEDDGLELTADEPPAAAAPSFERPSIWGSARADEGTEHESADVFGDARPESHERGAQTAESGANAPAEKAQESEAFDELAFLRSVIDPQASNPIVPRAPSSGEAQKTLRCTECGTMNLPTEWYCERCGGELAAF
jgi:hypothetical protein